MQQFITAFQKLKSQNVNIISLIEKAMKNANPKEKDTFKFLKTALENVQLVGSEGHNEGESQKAILQDKESRNN